MATEPKAKAPERDLPPDSGDPTPHPRYDERIEGDAFEVMQKYQVVTLPPNARLELMKMKLPEAPAELLQDTVPPNGNVKGPPVPTEMKDGGTTTDAPVVDRSRSNDTLIIPRVQRQKRLRSIVIVALCAGVALLAVGIIVSQSGEANAPAIEAGDVEVSPVNAAAEQSATAMPVAPAQPPDPPQTAATSAKPAEKQPAGASVENGDKPTAPARPVTSKPQSAPEASKSTTQPPPTKSPATTSKTGSAFDGLMRPPSE